jgi:hypothetical protein
MRLASFEAIVKVLEKAGVRYLVADGLAVNDRKIQQEDGRRRTITI